MLLKPQSREIFDHYFVRQLPAHRPLINTLKYFCISFDFAEIFATICGLNLQQFTVEYLRKFEKEFG
jgi:hypothetical protein